VTWRFVEHVGEVEVELEAMSEAGIFEAALGAFAELVALSGGEPASREIDLDAGDLALLLVDWLGELVYLAEVERFVPRRVVAIEVVGNSMRATVEGRLGDPRHFVKAVTLNRLQFEQEGELWHARVVLDV
jgi:SHS2 domain-containing protein